MLLAWISAVAAVAVPLQDEDPSLAFLRGFEAASALTDQGKWSAAREAWRPTAR